MFFKLKILIKNKIKNLIYLTIKNQFNLKNKFRETQIKIALEI